MKIVSSCIIAFSMYSRFPMPKVEWKQENMKYVMCFFPAVGALEGIFLWGAGNFLFSIPVSSMLFSVCMALLPLGITGGIHMDGFLDTVDALSSYGDREKKLSILKDPHTGAFAVIWGMAYLLFTAGLFSELSKDALPALSAVPVLSRAVSGYSVVAFPTAKKSGFAADFHETASKTTVKIVMACYIAAALAFLFFCGPLYAVMAGACTALSYGIHHHNCYQVFGGITGDLAGYFLQICELLLLFGIVVLQFI